MVKALVYGSGSGIPLIQVIVISNAGAWLNNAILRSFSLAEQCHTQKCLSQLFQVEFWCCKKKIWPTHWVDKEDNLKMKLTSKMKTTSKWRRPPRMKVTKKMKMTLEIKSTLKMKTPKNYDYLKMKTTSKIKTISKVKTYEFVTGRYTWI